MTIQFFPKYTRNGASSRYRTYQYIELFKNQGVNCKIDPFFNNKYLKYFYSGNKIAALVSIIFCFCRRFFIVLFLKKNQILFIEKELIPYFPPILEWYIAKRKIKFILDYDDAIIHNYDLSNNSLVRKILGSKIPYIQTLSTAVINGSKYLVQLSNKNNKNTFYIPTSLNIKKYKQINIEENKPFIIGWIGSLSTSKLIIPFIDILEDFCCKYNAKLHLIGFDESLTINKKNVIYIRWSEQNEVAEINNFSIGISPSIDTPFARGKCAFKSIQYMACAKPVITSPVGANKHVVEHNVSGFHANSNEEWIKHLEYLIKNPEILKKMGLKGEQRVENEFSIQNNYMKYLKIFNEISNGQIQ